MIKKGRIKQIYHVTKYLISAGIVVYQLVKNAPWGKNSKLE